MSALFIAVEDEIGTANTEDGGDKVLYVCAFLFLKSNYFYLCTCMQSLAVICTYHK